MSLSVYQYFDRFSGTDKYKTGAAYFMFMEKCVY